jgi:hydroxymethylpyrimidine/phosphomethylpyrimidine kinase
MNPEMEKHYTRLLTIAGSDSGGGAGIQADMKTFAALGCFGMSVVTALTAQNTLTVKSIYEVTPGFVADQMDAVLEDIGVDAVKIGMLSTSGVIETVADKLKEYGVTKVVLDPVMIAKSGDKLLRDEAVDALKNRLIPLAEIITPNIPEAEVLAGRPISGEAMLTATASELAGLGSRSVLIKGGHFEGGKSADLLFVPSTDGTNVVHRFERNRIDSRNTHGTGCTLSSAIASFLGKGLDIKEAVEKAKAYTTEAIRKGAHYKTGSGHGPVHHFHAFWE